MTVATAVAAGAALGVRHALETDHLAAVATLVDGETDRADLVGASWGVGHAIPIALLGLTFLLLGVTLPDPVSTGLEALVGVTLVVLGARTLGRVLTGRVRSHEHGGGRHAHLRLGELSLGLTHHHVDDEGFLVGVLHGFAGSGALVVAMVSTAPSMWNALWFLAAFSVLTVLTMTTIASLWGRITETPLRPVLEAVAGGLGIAVGGLLLAAQAGLAVPI